MLEEMQTFVRFVGRSAKSRVSPVDAGCSERHSALDQFFVDRAAKATGEPKLPDAAHVPNVWSLMSAKNRYRRETFRKFA